MSLPQRTHAGAIVQECNQFRRTVMLAGLALLAIALIRTAWLSDDAYISFRTADNILHGYGPVWNTGERVQAYTHPLWLAICTSAFAVTGDVFYTAIGLTIVLTIAGALLMAKRLAIGSSNLFVCFAAMLSSKAFIDFSTSGLENALSHFLLLLFVWRWWTEPHGSRRLQRLSALAGLCLLSRLDLVFLVVPALAVEGWRVGPRASVRPLVIGLLPVVAWEAFSLFYYGTPLPNTAYAKLNTVMPASLRLERGLDYYYQTLVRDPATLPVIALALVSLAGRGLRRDWPLLAGIGLILLYILRVGGDFMMGRFLTAPFVVAVAVVARSEWILSWRRALAVATATLMIGLLAPWEPALVSGFGYSYVNNLLHGRRTREPSDNMQYLVIRGINDERRFYYEFAGLLKARPGKMLPEHMWSRDGSELREKGVRVAVRANIGLVGYFAGPGVHIVDPYALSDPLLARIPGGLPDPDMGHHRRVVPVGYLETLETGVNQLGDPDLAVYYDSLRTVIAGPLWSARRLTTLVSFLTGRYDDYLSRYVSRATLAHDIAHVAVGDRFGRLVRFHRPASPCASKRRFH